MLGETLTPILYFGHKLYIYLEIKSYIKYYKIKYILHAINIVKFVIIWNMWTSLKVTVSGKI